MASLPDNEKLRGLSMTTLSKLLTSAAAAASIVAFAGSASAATFVSSWTVFANGEISVTFGDNGLGVAGSVAPADGLSSSTHAYDAGTGVFTDTFNFNLPTGYVVNAGGSTSTDLTFSTATFNGFGGSVNNSVPNDHRFLIAFQPVVNGSGQQLVITGVGAASNTWAGTASFVPVPEPTTWGLMIMGFGGVGALLRNRRRQVAAFA
jgi:hypothetical protein